MKKISFFMLFLFTVSFAFAGTQYVDECRYINVSDSGDTFVLNDNLDYSTVKSAMGCIVVEGGVENITIDCDGYSIDVAGWGLTNTAGIWFSSLSGSEIKNVTITGCTIMNAADNGIRGGPGMQDFLLVNSTLKNNDLGIYLISPPVAPMLNFAINGNSFVNNAVHLNTLPAIPPFPTLTFNGNCWSDYSGSGPYEIVTDKGSFYDNSPCSIQQQDVPEIVTVSVLAAIALVLIVNLFLKKNK